MGCSLTGLVFEPPNTKPRRAHSILTLRTSDGNIIPARFFNLGYHFTMIISHGNAEDIQRVEDWVERVFVHKVKVNVMVYEYTGYSNTEGTPSENFVYSDCEAALAFLTDEVRIPKERIILYGRSLGSGPSCYLAEKYPDLAGLILQTPLTSVFRVLLEFRFTMPGDMFPNINRIKEIELPLLFIHGTRDEIVPMKHTKELFKFSASRMKEVYYIEGAGHNNIESVGGESFFEKIEQFVESLDRNLLRYN